MRKEPGPNQGKTLNKVETLETPAEVPVLPNCSDHTLLARSLQAGTTDQPLCGSTLVLQGLSTYFLLASPCYHPVLRVSTHSGQCWMLCSSRPCLTPDWQC